MNSSERIAAAYLNLLDPLSKYLGALCDPEYPLDKWEIEELERRCESAWRGLMGEAARAAEDMSA